MDERKFKILLLWVTPVGFLLAIWINFDDIIKMGYLIPMLIALPIGMFLSYLIYIRGIHDGELFKNSKDR